MQKGLNMLLCKYSVDKEATLTENGAFVTIDGEKIPVLPYEAERRFTELRNLVKGGRVGDMCTYRIGHTAKAGTDLFDLLAREIGVLTFTVDSPVTEIFAIAGTRAMNCIAETENGCVCTIELGATLAEGEEEIDKHEIITDRGVACDRVVDTQIPQNSIYVFGKKSAAFRDTDAELYGYGEEEIAVIRTAFALARDCRAREDAKAKKAHVDAVVRAARTSLETLENVKVGG